MATKLAQKIQITEQTSRTMVENQLRIGLDVVCYQRGTCERDLVFEFSFLFLLVVFFFSSRRLVRGADLFVFFSLYGFGVTCVVFFLRVRLYRYI